MTQEDLKEILNKHSKWRNAEDGGECADLEGANLIGADLCGADLIGANLRGADLRGAKLRRADLFGADLRDADLSGADLRGANFIGADISGVDLTQTVYTGTVLNLQCPEEGSFIAWKKLKGDSIAKLLILEDAKRSSGTTRKCRASKAEVLAIYDEDGVEINEGRSWRKDTFIYRVGETVYPDKWDENRWNECSSGIHFFITRKEAEEYIK